MQLYVTFTDVQCTFAVPVIQFGCVGESSSDSAHSDDDDAESLYLLVSRVSYGCTCAMYSYCI